MCFGDALCAPGEWSHHGEEARNSEHNQCDFSNKKKLQKYFAKEARHLLIRWLHLCSQVLLQSLGGT